MVELFVAVIPGGAAPEHDGKGITIHGLRSAAISIFAAKGLTLAETADVMGQDDPLTTWRHYLKLFDRSKVSQRIRAAQESVWLLELRAGV